MNQEGIQKNIFLLFQTEIIFNNIFELTDDSTDEESIEECVVFIGKRWMDIDDEFWRRHFRAISFFNHSAKKNFFPSVMIEMLTNPSKVRLAFSSYIFEMSHNSNDCKIYELFIEDYNKLNCFCNWLELMLTNKDLEFDYARINTILNRITRLYHANDRDGKIRHLIAPIAGFQENRI